MSDEAEITNLSPASIARTAAEWWGAALRGEQGTGTSGDLAVDILLVPDHQREHVDTSRFEGRLAVDLEALLTNGDNAVLAVDYAPEGTLRRVLREAVISGEISERLVCHLPIKTTMWIDGSGILVRLGYGAATERLNGSAQ